MAMRIDLEIHELLYAVLGAYMLGEAWGHDIVWTDGRGIYAGQLLIVQNTAPTIGYPPVSEFLPQNLRLLSNRDRNIYATLQRALTPRGK